MKHINVIYILVFLISGCASSSIFDENILISTKYDRNEKQLKLEKDFIDDVSSQSIDRLIISDPADIMKYDMVFYLFNFSAAKELKGFVSTAKSVAVNSNSKFGFVFFDDHDDMNKFRIIASIFELPTGTRKPYILVQKRDKNVPIIIQVTDYSQAVKELCFIIENHNEQWEKLVLGVRLNKGKNLFLQKEINLNEIFVREYRSIQTNSF